MESFIFTNYDKPFRLIRTRFLIIPILVSSACFIFIELLLYTRISLSKNVHSLIFYIWLYGTISMCIIMLCKEYKNLPGLIFKHLNKTQFYYVLILFCQYLIFILSLSCIVCYVVDSLHIELKHSFFIDNFIKEFFKGNITVVITDIFIIVLMGPILEEIFFRGILLNRFIVKWNVLTGILISSFLFAIYHMTVTALIQFCAGVIFSIIYLKTQTIYSTIILHILNNLSALILLISLTYLPHDNNLQLIINHYGYIAIILLASSILGIIYQLTRKINLTTA